MPTGSRSNQSSFHSFYKVEVQLRKKGEMAKEIREKREMRLKEKEK